MHSHLYKQSLCFLVSMYLLILPAYSAPSLVINADSGEVLHAEEALTAWYPASLTKLMTVYIAFQSLSEGRIKPTQYLKVSATAAAQKPSKLGLKSGSNITVEAAIHALITKSANDIAYVLAEGISGNAPAFIARMNAEANRLGMNGTHYVNPNGLPNPNQVTTARDVAILSRAILHDFPQYESYFRVEGLQIGKKTQRSFNALLGRYSGAMGMKTGFICASGFNIVAAAARGDDRYIAVVLGETGGLKRAERAAELLDFAFEGKFKSQGFSVSDLHNLKNTPLNMHDQVCGPNRVVAGESDETLSNATDYNSDIPQGYGYGQVPRSRLAPKSKQFPAVNIRIEGTQKSETQIAYVDRGNGRPPLAANVSTAKPKPAAKPIGKPLDLNVKFMPAHPSAKERIEFHGRPKILPSYNQSN